MKTAQERTLRKTLTVATSRIPWQPLLALVGAIVVMSVVVLSGQELKHVPPAAPSFTVLYTFGGSSNDGIGPNGVIRDTAGNLYGTTFGGGFAGDCPHGTFITGCGTVFKLSPTGAETVLYRFTGGEDGGLSTAGLIQDAVGNLYGTTKFGGQFSDSCYQYSSDYGGCGVVFKLSPRGTETVLHLFTGGADGGNPVAGLVRDAAGNLYGTSVLGGGIATTACNPPNGNGCGVVFKLSSAGAETVLHSFTGGEDGAGPGELIEDAAGNLYGTTFGGGSGYGVVFELIRCDSEPSGYEFKVLYSFKGGADGANPAAGLIRDAVGNLYGTTQSGGHQSSACNLGNGGIGTCGVVFKLSPAGTETVLYRFTGGADGGNPVAGLVRDAAGNLHGTNEFAGDSTCFSPYGCGVVFELVRCTSAPSGYDFKALHTFTGGADGGIPTGDLIQDPAGNLYGTSQGGPNYSGVVFRLTP
jgi:uncharacterized repeat protein (TIGR03803 family)